MNIMTVTAQFNDRRRMLDEYEKMGLLFGGGQIDGQNPNGILSRKRWKW